MGIKKRILIVDDEPDFAEALGFLLAEHNFSIDWAFSGFEAESRIERDEFDYVITDFFMPGLNGYELYALVEKKQKVMPKFIVVSGDVRSIDRSSFHGQLLSIFPKSTHYKTIVDCLRAEDSKSSALRPSG